MNAPAACTIASNNYLPYARVFARSFLDRHPDGRVWALIVDRPEPSMDYGAEPFAVVFAEERIPAFRNLAFRYSILELNTAVKPYFLEHLLEERGCRTLCYFDPDVLVTGDLGPVYAALEGSDLALTPHVLQGIDDDRYPGERALLLSGIYNLGFLGLAGNQRTLPFLRWWQARLHRECLHRVERGLFVDQRWMDFAPAFLERVAILRDPGCNVAYWNLVHRRIHRAEDGYRVGEGPLRFFHFSGFDLDAPETLSRFQDRFTLDGRPDVRPLFEEYREALLREGAEELRGLPYAYGSFADGRPVPPLARRLLQRLDPAGELWPDPFASGEPGGYLAWLTEPVPTASGVPLPRLALALWDERPDLQVGFPSPLGPDALAFARWLVEGADRSSGLDRSFLEATEGALREAGGRGRPHPRAARAGDAGRLLGSLTSRGGLPSGRLDRDLVQWWTSTPDAGLRGGSRVTRLALRIHGQRADLQATFPDPLGASREGLALWLVTYGRLEYALPGSLVGPALRSLPPRRQAWARLWWLRRRAGALASRLRHRPSARPEGGAAGAGAPHVAPPPAGLARAVDSAGPPDPPKAVTVVGWAAAATGVGEACRGNLAALEAAGVPYSLVGLRHPALDPSQGGAGPSVEDRPSLLEGRAAAIDPRAPVLLCHVNADMMPAVRAQLPRSVAAGKRVVGYWFWELAHFPLAFADSFRGVDEVWAPSRFCQQAFSALAPCEVRWVPPGVRAPAAVAADRRELGIPAEAFCFLFVFDALSVPERKNPEALLRAFERVAGELGAGRVHLLLKLSHAEGQPELVERLERRAGRLPVTLLARAVERDVLHGLFAASDAYVSLHRSEGLGLPMIEAMLLGKPVVATGYGGCTDFLDEATGWPVRYRIEPLGEPRGPYPAGAVWASADEEHAAEQMLAVARSPELRGARTAAARRRVEELYAPAAAGRRLREELERIS